MLEPLQSLGTYSRVRLSLWADSIAQPQRLQKQKRALFSARSQYEVS